MRSGEGWLRRWLLGGLPGLLLLWLAACNGAAKQEAVQVPADLKAGEANFTAHCARCHGEQARGTALGPPLVHKIYEPNHHGDLAFQRAAMNGVRAHHWNFGDMPRIEGVTAEEVDQIIAYIRYLQRAAGIL